MTSPGFSFGAPAAVKVMNRSHEAVVVLSTSSMMSIIEPDLISTIGSCRRCVHCLRGGGSAQPSVCSQQRQTKEIIIHRNSSRSTCVVIVLFTSEAEPLCDDCDEGQRVVAHSSAEEVSGSSASLRPDVSSFPVVIIVMYIILYIIIIIIIMSTKKLLLLFMDGQLLRSALISP